MRPFRFHLDTLVILVLILGVGFAALRESNETWDSSIFSLTLGMLSVSILLAIHRTERRRAFWLGFALFGWTYVGLSLVPSVEPRLITTKALAYLDSKVPDRSIVIGGRVWDTWSSKPTQNNQSVNSTSIAFSPQGNLVSQRESASPSRSYRNRKCRRDCHRLDHELHPHWSLAPRVDRRNPGRAAFPSPPCQESGESLGTAQPRAGT